MIQDFVPEGRNVGDGPEFLAAVYPEPRPSGDGVATCMMSVYGTEFLDKTREKGEKRFLG